MHPRRMVRPDREWIPRRLFDGTEVLFPPGTHIAEDAEGNWILLERRRLAHVLPHAEGRLLLRRHVVQPGRLASTRRSSGPVSDIPDEHLKLLAEYGRVALSEHRLRHARLGLRRLLPRPEPDHRPRQQRHAGAARRVDDDADDREGDLPRDDGPLGGGDDPVPEAGARGGGRLLLRLGHRRRRQRHAARRVHPAGAVGRDDQAALQEAVRLDSRQHALEDLPALAAARSTT